VLLGPLSLDHYLDEGITLPGGGVLNMAHHWAHAGLPFQLLSRIGDDQPGLFLDFLDLHGIARTPTIVGPGRSASIDIVMRADRQPWMDNFVDGVWGELQLADAEVALIASADRLHAVLVEPVVQALLALDAQGALARPVASADFLSFRRWDVDRFARVMAFLDIGFIGWPGAVDDPLLDDLRDVTFDLGKLLVVTMGDREVLVADGRRGPIERRIPVDAVAVQGTTVGCGDAFISAFLARRWADDDIVAAVEAGKVAGAEATTWVRPLPESAYPTFHRLDPASSPKLGDG
jgi:sugar/nucleoside kinase (ribokinase family)